MSEAICEAGCTTLAAESSFHQGISTVVQDVPARTPLSVPLEVLDAGVARLLEPPRALQLRRPVVRAASLP